MATTKPGKALADEIVTDAQRRAIQVTTYDLSIKIDPAASHMEALARLTLRNAGAAPLTRVALQISSSLHWNEISSPGSGKNLWDQHRVETDADHTGAATEAVVTLPHALAPGEAVALTTFYDGTLQRSSARLARLGASTATADRVEWDRVEESGTSLRGFGNVLWYPVAAPPVSLEDGAALAEEAGRQKLINRAAQVRLRVAAGFSVNRPGAIFFCGRRGVLAVSSENTESAEGAGPGLATAEFAAEPLGFRPLSLFVLAAAPEIQGDLLEVAGGSKPEMEALGAAADRARPLVSEWFGVRPLGKVTAVLQDGESFADGSFVVAPAGALRDATAMTGALAHAWFRSAQPWLDSGVAELLSLLSLERSNGRAAAVSQIVAQSHALALAESNMTGSGPSSGLPEASGAVALQNKALAVLWMLRAITTDAALQQALQRTRADATLDGDPHGLQRALEQTSGKPLGWFFNDWVDHDRGLPDLQIVSVTPRPVEGRNGRPEGVLVAVEVRNDGGAVAEVPVTVRSGELSATERLRVPGHASASVRIVFQGAPEQVQVNDGTVPEIAGSVHVRRITVQP